MSEANAQTLPQGWVEAPLRDTLLPTSTTNPTRDGEGEFIYVDIDAVDNERQRIVKPKVIANADAPSRARNKLASGDVIFSLVRPYLKNIAIVSEELDGAVASTAFFVCRPGSGVDSRFLLNLLRRESFINSITTYGNSPPAARDDEFERLTIPIPPSKEQERIADQLDELLSDLDAGVGALEGVRKKLEQYRAAVLKAAVEGSLTAEWRRQHPNTEPASQLLTRVLAERRYRWESEQLRKFAEAGKEPPKNWKANYKEPVEPNTSELPDLPKGWAWVLSDALFTFVTSGSRGWAEYYSEEGALFLRIGNLDHDSITLDFTKTQRVSPPEGTEGIRTKVMPGDILISITADVGMIGLAPDDIEIAYINQHIALTRTVECINRRYLAWYLAAATTQYQFKQMQRGATKVGLGLDDIRAVAVALPSLAEQNAIVEAIEDQLSVIEHTESDIESKLKSAQALRQSILREAFAGRLVPQDPADEPASELLKRIATERARRAADAKRTAAKPKQTRKRAGAAS